MICIFSLSTSHLLPPSMGLRFPDCIHSSLLSPRHISWKVKENIRYIYMIGQRRTLSFGNGTFTRYNFINYKIPIDGRHGLDTNTKRCWVFISDLVTFTQMDFSPSQVKVIPQYSISWTRIWSGLESIDLLTPKSDTWISWEVGVGHPP